MPRIPTSGRQVQNNVFNAPQARAKAPVVGISNTGEQLSGLTDKLYNLYQEERDRNLKAEVDAGTNELRDIKNKQLHGDQESGEVGYYGLKGKETLGNFKGYKDSYLSKSDEVLSKYGEEARKRLVNIRDRIGVDYEKELNVHSSRQMEQHYIQQTEANIKSLQQDAVLNYDKFNANGVPIPSASLASLKEQIYGTKDDKGNIVSKGYMQYGRLPKEQADALFTESASKLHFQVISQAASDGRTRIAQSLFDQAVRKKEVTGEDALRIGKILKGSSLRTESQEAVDAISGMVSSGQLKDQFAARDYIRANYSGELEDAIMSRFSARQSEVKAKKEYFDKGFVNGEADKIAADPEAYKFTNEVFQTLEYEDQRSLQNYQNSLIKQKYGAKDSIKTNWRVYNDYINKPSEELRPLDVLRSHEKGDLSTTETKELLNLAKANKEAHTNVQTLNGFVSSVVDDAGISGTLWGFNPVETLEDETFIRNLFAQRLNEYPPEDRKKQDTWEKVREDILKVRKDKGYNEQYWRALQKKQKGTPFSNKEEYRLNRRRVNEAGKISPDGSLQSVYERTLPNGTVEIRKEDGTMIGVYGVGK